MFSWCEWGISFTLVKKVPNLKSLVLCRFLMLMLWVMVDITALYWKMHKN